MIDLFHEIPEGVVILRSKGVFKQAKLFRRGENVYASHGTGFVRLLQGGGTTVPTINWLDLHAEGVRTIERAGPKWGRA